MVVWVAVAGALGALARYTVHHVRAIACEWPVPVRDGRRQHHRSVRTRLPHRPVPVPGARTRRARAIVGTGFLGAYTTFSSFSYETFGLLRDEVPVGSLVNAFGSVAVGILAAAAGLGLAGLF